MHLFAGAGGGLLGDLILGHNPRIAVEWEEYPARTLAQRAAEGWFSDLEVWNGDVRHFDPTPWAGRIHCINAGFPCQDLSVAGKGAGLAAGTRSGLYREVLRIADAIRPRFIFLENSPNIVNAGLELVIADLAARGFSAEWDNFSAAQVGAPHRRERWFCLAEMGNAPKLLCDGCDNDSREQQQPQAIPEPGNASWQNAVPDPKSYRLQGEQQSRISAEGSGQRLDSKFIGNGFRVGSENQNVPNPDSIGRCSGSPRIQDAENVREQRSGSLSNGWWSYDPSEWDSEPQLGRMANGMGSRMDFSRANVKPAGEARAKRLKAIGNGQVPLVAAVAFTILKARLEQAKGSK